MSHLDELLTGRNYFFICLRFGSQEDFQIDKDRLTPFDYLYVMYSLERKMSDEEAMDCFYQTAQKECEKTFYFAASMPELRDRRQSPSPFHIKSLGQACYYIRSMNLSKATEECKEWEDKVKEGIAGELRYLQNTVMTDDDYKEGVYHLLQQSIAAHLPSQYKSPSLHQLSEQNSAVNDLIKEFGLDEVKGLPF